MSEITINNIEIPMAGESPVSEGSFPAVTHYEKSEWHTGDIVSSAKLNNIENGLNNRTPQFVNIDAQTGLIDHTWSEIREALTNRIVVLVEDVRTYYQSTNETIETARRQALIIGAGRINNEGTDIYVVETSIQLPLGCSGPDDYPSINFTPPGENDPSMSSS